MDNLIVISCTLLCFYCRVEYRDKMYVMKLEEKKLKEQEKQQESEEREKVLEALREQVHETRVC